MIQAGKEFLESHGMTVTDDDVKTRGQKEKLEEINAPTEDQAAASAEAAEDDKGEEGKGEEGKTEEGTGEEEEKVEESKGEGEDNEACPPPPKVPRDGTMVVTAKVSMVIGLLLHLGLTNQLF